MRAALLPCIRSQSVNQTAAEALALARHADPVIAQAIENASGWPCTTFDRYAATCLLGFADRALDAQEAA